MRKKREQNRGGKNYLAGVASDQSVALGAVVELAGRTGAGHGERVQRRVRIAHALPAETFLLQLKKRHAKTKSRLHSN